ncbi:MAG: methyltransferase domain-containing protein [Bacteroidia bacterium]
MDKNQIILNTYNKAAKQYQDKFMNMDLYHPSYDLFCKLIAKRNAEIFEIACGPGNITNYLLKSRPDFKIVGIDFSPAMIELAKVNNPTATFQVMDARHIDKIDKKYDAIICGFCLPYLTNEEATKLIGDAAQLLQPNGLLYISTMEDDATKSGFEKPSFTDYGEIYINYHQADYLISIFNQHHFKIIDLKRQDYPEKDGTFSTDMIFIAQLK